MARPLQILLLCDYRDDIAATVREHVDALTQYSQHCVRHVSILGDLPRRLDLNHFDAVVIHYSLIACHNAYVSAAARTALGEFGGLKAIFIQDEYRFVDATIAAMQEIGIDVLFTCVPEAEIEKVYPSMRLPGVTKVSVLTGYVPEHLLSKKVLPFSRRPVDVGYRARKVPAWLGDLGQEKYQIGKRFQEDAAPDKLALDFSFREEDRIYGEAWIDFVASCKAMLGVESGASVFDFTGEIQRQVENHSRREPGVAFGELKRRYFAEAEGKIRLNQISPRCFEASALRTLLILYEGDYSGRMQPWRHYVPLRKDHSNHLEVVSVLKDGERAKAIIDAAYREVACDPANSYRAMVGQFDEAIRTAFREHQKAPLAALDDRELARFAAPGLIVMRRKATRKLTEKAYRFLFSTLLGSASAETRDVVHGWLNYLSRPLRVVVRWIRS
ncbi:hypothetical protein [Bradyrhizobium sp. JYMT SZCCT0428]|uniref:hypothetical protein n=1 Tax=Bradyrhizobium sp. JYMT SZCCT0428 TaxID=2807673 RepID=UPI001BA43D1E|nr:hypothetical protein [Bradyrhizobium sp. JYMT SZCCT0428]MBR1156111.1 hypothetical protein [Bradyrhizobium sp. JYMT SZCCT0428]